ncbi:hypothetical protein C5167_028333 [Papaver somniferum]|nr:hypothetical protein C5167_028333 [Papaver somniferum]
MLTFGQNDLDMNLTVVKVTLTSGVPHSSVDECDHWNLSCTYVVSIQSNVACLSFYALSHRLAYAICVGCSLVVMNECLCTRNGIDLAVELNLSWELHVNIAW